MAYSAGDTILDDEYNNFVNSSSSPFGYNHFAGTGSAQYGLGQSAIATVSAGATINASNWNTFFTALDTIANHTNDTMTSRSSVSAGDAIAIKAAVASDLATLAASVAAGSPNATALSDDDQGTSTNSGTWTSSSTIERSVTFASADAMRHFFNAGGSIKCDPGTSGSTNGGKDIAFASMVAALGVLTIKAHATAQSGGDGGDSRASFDSGNGFHDLGTSYTSKIKYTSSDYTSNYNSSFIEISAKLNAAVGSATIMTIKLASSDPVGDQTYTANNTDGKFTNESSVPAMSLNIVASEPTAAQGLSSAIQVSSNAQVSNSQS
tara:strand:+ start:82 stop:1047 length:966 start_codon:yes stop_codon:yes gene_type:complete